MTSSPIFDGPHRIRNDELREAERIARICFSLDNESSPQEDASESSDHAQYYQDGETYVIAADGKPVSQIATFQERLYAFDGLLRLGCIGGVCTHPDYRGHGLATRLMEHCTQSLVEGGARVMLISGGRGLYTRLGNVPAGKYANFTIQTGQAAHHPGSIVLRPIIEQDAKIYAALCSQFYSREPVHFERNVEYFLDHFHHRDPKYNQEEWIIEIDGHPKASLFLITDWQFIGQPEIGQRRIYEYAGSRAALAAALPIVVEQPEIDVLEAGIPWQDSDFIDLLSKMGYRPEWTALDGHTMRIINFPAMLQDLQNYIQSRLSPSLTSKLKFEQTGPLLGANSDDHYAIACGMDRLELDGAQMTGLVMGSPTQQNYQFPGALGEVIPALFPLPSFLPGINYH